MRVSLSLLHILVFSITLSCVAQQKVTAPVASPPMGWNSWDSYGLTVTESEFHENASAMRLHLLSYGWKYAVLDEGWYFVNPEDRRHPDQLRYVMDFHGRFLPAENRFPSARKSDDGETPVQYGQTTVLTQSAGLRPLGEWLHAQGMLFGIHIIRGIPRESVRLDLPIEGSPFHAKEAADQSDACPWDPTSWGVRDDAAGQAWYDSLLKQYASWGVDFLKVDCIADHPYRESEIKQIRRAIDKTGKEMVLSLSPGPTSLSHGSAVSALAEMWRISNDVWDVWDGKGDFPQSAKGQFDRVPQWTPFVSLGHWPDADMLPLGQLTPRPDVGPGARSSRLSPEEQKSLMTLWTFARSPLIMGGNLTKLDESTMRLLTNRDLIEVDQTAVDSKQLERSGDFIVWEANLPNGRRAFAFFNLGDTTLDVTDRVRGLLQTAGGKTVWKDLWSACVVRRDEAFTVHIAPHASNAYALEPAGTGTQVPDCKAWP